MPEPKMEEVKIEINQKQVKLEDFINKDISEVLKNGSRGGITGL